MKAGAFPASLLTGGGEEACVMDHKALPYLSGGSCMCITGICMLNATEGSAALEGGGVKKGNFISLLKKLPQITWGNI